MFWISIFGCMGPDADTLVDELRVMAIQFEPAEIRLQDFFPDEQGNTSPPDINIAVGDPLGRGYRMAVWPCTNLGEGCQEREVFKENPSDWVTLIEGTESLVTTPIINNPIWPIFAQGREPIFLTSLFVLVCEPSCTRRGCPCMPEKRHI